MTGRSAGPPRFKEGRRGPGGAGQRAGRSAPGMVEIELVGTDEEGLLVCRLAEAAGRHRSRLLPVRVPPGLTAPAIGARALARIEPGADGPQAVVVKLFDAAPERLFGTLRETARGFLLEPVSKRQRQEYRIAADDTADAGDGDLVVAEATGSGGYGLPSARVVERIGRGDDPRAASLIAIAENDIPPVFPDEALAEAAAARPVDLGRRTDLRPYPLVTIDGADARDFDDAVWAEPDPETPGGWHLLVAIADVAWYVTPGSALDREAERRGNSVYFPDRVVPMLPAALSDDLCSLRPNVPRPCLAVHLWIDAEGTLTRSSVVRGLMESRARLTYEQVEAAIAGTPDGIAAPLLDPVIRPLYGAYEVLKRARDARGALDLDLPERRVMLAADGQVSGIELRARLASHMLIEEFMILANVAAATMLERLRQPCMYRIHAAPDTDRIDKVAEFLSTLDVPGLTLAKGQRVDGRRLNRVIQGAADTPFARVVNELILRAQAQAAYSPANIGHFGLQLERYAHFTSPIRRYADLLVHRALIAGAGLGSDGLKDGESGLEVVGRAISQAERRAIAAERGAVDRFVAAFLKPRTGAIFPARVNGVTKFGLFVTLLDIGADGLVPVATLPGDYYVFDERRQQLVGRRTRRSYALGQLVRAQLTQVDTAMGLLTFTLAGGGRRDGADDGAAPDESASSRGARRGRPPRR